MVEAHYKMAAVVRLTGIPANTIRTWERRYGIVQPDRSPGGARLYREDDVTRLQLLSALLDCGEAIGALADQSTAELRARLAGHRRVAVETSEASTRASMAVLGQGLASQMRAAPPHARIELQVPFDGGGVDEFLAHPPRVDVLLVHLPVLGNKPVSTFHQLMQASAARLGLVIYDYANASTLWRLADAGARLVSGPTRAASLFQIVQDHLALDIVRQHKPFTPPAADDVRPERYFSPSQLGWLKEANNGIECECPNHLASIIETLNGFEDYSLRCEARNEDDAALHDALALGAAHSRHQLEILLQSIIEADNLDIPGR